MPAPPWSACCRLGVVARAVSPAFFQLRGLFQHPGKRHKMKSDPLITYRRKPATLDADSLQSFAEVLRDRVARGREFHCLITNDAELRSLNAQFRGVDSPTDVLSFLSFPNSTPPTPLSSPTSSTNPSPPNNPNVGRPI